MRFSLLVLALFIAAIAPARADYRSEYRAYNDAFMAGDLSGALKHGEAAWRAAEEELGDDGTTAILALNYANLVAPYSAEKAYEAYARALEITRMGLGALNALELELRTAETRLAASPDNKEFAQALENTLQSATAIAAPPAEAMALGWKTLAIHELQRRRIKPAKAAADSAVEFASRLEPRIDRLLAETLFVAGSARLAEPYRTEEDIVEAVAYFDAMFPLFPPQADIDSFDRLLARAMQMRATAGAIANSVELTPFFQRSTDSRLPTGENLATAFERAQRRSETNDQFRWRNPHPAHCNFQDIWDERKAPRYPVAGLHREYVGAVLVGFDFGETGVARTVLLADFEEAGFGEAAVKGVEKWTLKQPLPQECRRNHIVIFSFQIVN